MTELASCFDELRTEITRVREVGYETHHLHERGVLLAFATMLRDCRGLLSGEGVGAQLSRGGLVIIDIVGLSGDLRSRLVRAVRTAALNRELAQQKSISNRKPPTALTRFQVRGGLGAERACLRGGARCGVRIRP